MSGQMSHFSSLSVCITVAEIRSICASYKLTAVESPCVHVLLRLPSFPPTIGTSFLFWSLARWICSGRMTANATSGNHGLDALRQLFVSGTPPIVLRILVTVLVARSFGNCSRGQLGSRSVVDIVRSWKGEITQALTTVDRRPSSPMAIRVKSRALVPPSAERS